MRGHFMLKIDRLVLATNNAGKLREFNALLAPLGITVLPQAQLGVVDAEEPHATFIENALAKARHASRHTGLPALADDSGICAEALGGAPGVLSARYAGEPRSDARNNAKLVDTLNAQTDKRAYYYCVLVLLRHAEDPQPIITEGIWHGQISATPRGAGGFGYDPHFFLPERNCTAAELLPEEKNRISHRAQAMHSLLERLRAGFGA